MVRIAANAKSVCVEDFCGTASPGGFPVSFWADYYPEYGITRFGGDWQGIPDMSSSDVPSEARVHAWAKRHMNKRSRR